MWDAEAAGVGRPSEERGLRAASALPRGCFLPVGGREQTPGPRIPQIPLTAPVL